MFVCACVCGCVFVCVVVCMCLYFHADVTVFVSKRRRGTAGDEKGGVWPYSTDSNSTPDTGYSLTQQLFYFSYLALC